MKNKHSIGNQFSRSRTEVDNKPDLEKRAEQYRSLLGVEDLDALTDQLLSLRKAQQKDGPQLRRIYDLGGPLPENGIEIVSKDPRDRLSIEPARRPGKALASWGLAGRSVKVTAAAPFGFARIRFALPAKKVGHLYPGTIVAARWDPHFERFRLIPASGYSETGEYAFAQITRPGIFTAVGLPRDPRILLVLRLLATLAPWAEAARLRGTPLVEPMVKALLKQTLVRKFAQDSALLDTFGYRKSDFPVRFDRLDNIDFSGGNLDAVLDKLPELDLLDVLGDPNRMIKPVPDLRLPDDWPMPRGRWESLGPINVTGRIKALAIHPREGDILYAGAAGSGVWKTTNGGRDWFPTMRDERSLAIGGLAIAPSSPDVLYAATGEWTGKGRRSDSPAGAGAGVYRTSDGGRAWVLCGSIASDLCTSVAVHPSDPNQVYVGGNSGLHRSRDGGLTWDVPRGNRRALLEAGGTVASVALSPDDPRRIMAGVHRVGVFRSEDGGDTWEALDLERNGLPRGRAANAPKIAMGRGRGAAGRFVAIKMGDRIYTSSDQGRTYTRRADTPDRSPSMIPWCNVIASVAGSATMLLAGGTNLYRSEDAGEAWTHVAGYGSAVHQDQQAIAFDRANPNRVFLANDGGVWESTDQGATWRFASHGLIAAQAYAISVSQAPALRYAASLQDFSAHVFEGQEIWTDLARGEGGYVHFAPDHGDHLYHDTWWSSLVRLERRASGDWGSIDFDADTGSEFGQPLAIARTHPDLLLAISEGGGAIVRSDGRDMEQEWPEVLAAIDEPLTVVVIAPSDHRRAYAADAAGRMWLSSDQGQTWSRAGRPVDASGPVLSIAVDRSDPDRIFVGTANADAYRLTWGQVGGSGQVAWRQLGRVGLAVNSPDVQPCTLVQHPKWEDTFIVAGGYRVLRSSDGGRQWQAIDGSLPNARLMGAEIRAPDDSLYLGTHGRGLYRLVI